MKNQKKLHWKIEKKKKNTENLSASNNENPANMVPYFKKKKLLKILENCEKYWKSQGNLSVRKSGSHESVLFKIISRRNSIVS